MRRNRVRTISLVGVVTLLLAGSGYAGYVAVRVAIGECLGDVLPGAIFDEDLVTRPYVQDVTASSATLMWWAPDEPRAVVRYGVAPALTEVVAVPAPAAQPHEVVLSDLLPATAYAYEVVVADDAAIGGAFRTAPGPEATVTVGVIGDSGTGSDDQRAVAQVLAGLAPSAVIHTGDVVYRFGALCRYDDRYFAPYGNLIGSVPFYPAIGNHDLQAADGAAYFAVFRVPPATPEGGERFYAFDHGPICFLVLDGETVQPGGDPVLAARQLAWLDAELATRDGPPSWTIAVLHRPLVTSSTDDTGAGAVRDAFAARFAAGGVDLVLSGHVHAYERSVPLDGVTYVVSGGGGAALHEVRAGGEIAVAAAVHHALRLTASPTMLEGVAVAIDGSVVDRFVLSG